MNLPDRFPYFLAKRSEWEYAPGYICLKCAMKALGEEIKPKKESD